MCMCTIDQKIKKKAILELRINIFIIYSIIFIPLKGQNCVHKYSNSLAIVVVVTVRP